MGIWHVLLYVFAAVWALRSFTQLLTNYKTEFEQQMIQSEMARLKQELQQPPQVAPEASTTAPSKTSKAA